MNIEKIQQMALRMRRSIIVQLYQAKSGHPGGSLSAVELLAYLWGEALRFDPADPCWPKRDRFVLSKGHACPALYAALAEVGALPHRNLLQLRKIGSPLQGHPHVGALSCVETSSGSLGQGFSVAIGMALGLQHKGASSLVCVMLGDGEQQEGSVWEGAMCAGHFRLGNITAIIDYNKMQSDDMNENVLSIEPLREKWEAFGWHVLDIDGHTLDQINGAWGEARARADRPTVVIAHTIKGKGVSYMEGSPLWHGSVMLRREEAERALRDLGVKNEDLGEYLDGSIWS